MAPTSSQHYGMNLVHFLSDLGGAEKWNVNVEDEVIRGSLITHQGEITWPPPPLNHPVEVKKDDTLAHAPPALTAEQKAKRSATRSAMVLAALAGVLFLLGAVAPPAFVAHLTVFVLAVFVGWQVVWNVTAALHTPLMSVTNAISGIIIVGGMLQISGPTDSYVTILGAIAILVATINIAGGFLVTQRMLKMFSK